MKVGETMKRLQECIKELSDEDIEKIILSWCITEIEPDINEKDRIYIKEAIQNMINLHVTDHNEGMIISLDWVMPRKDYDDEKIVYEKTIESFYVNFDLLKTIPKEKWFEHRYSIEGMDWYKVLGLNYYYKGDLSDSIERIIHEMVVFGNNADDCLTNSQNFFEKMRKKREDMKNKESKTYTIEESMKMLEEKFGFDLKKHDEISKKLDDEYSQSLKEYIIQNNNHIIEVVEDYIQ